ncbi:MAG: transketolase family protein, partial [Oscillospiraceae bacterium]
MANSSCRKEFTDALLQHAKKDKKIYTVATDSRGSVTSDRFFDELPQQSVELGIAEQNAVAFAAGLALTGKNVFVTGPACFLAARSFEQIKVDVAYNETNVKIIGVSGGVSYGPLGGTHTSLHDIASMRALPNIEVFIPSDGCQTRAITNYMAEKKGPVYMRTGRGDVPQVYMQNEKFDIKKAKILQNGTDVTIIACGEMVHYAKLAGEQLSQQ